MIDNRAKMRHRDVVIKTIPDLLVSVKAARGGDWPGSKVLVGAVTAAVPEAMRGGMAISSFGSPERGGEEA